MTDLTTEQPIEPRIERLPNVLLIHCHDLGRFLGCYGIATVRTPALDGLAADGVRFATAFGTAPQCSPSRASLFTGRHPHTTGVMGLTHDNRGWDLGPGERHLAGLLRDRGYRTELVGVHHESRTGPDDEVAARLGFDRVTTGGKAAAVADRASEALRAARDDGRPWYLQTGFTEPHRLTPPVAGGDRLGFLGEHITADDSLGVTVPPYLVDDDSTRAEMAELQGAVAHVDAAIGRVLRTLDELGMTDDTIVVFTTDHGLALPRAKCTLYDPGLETALIMRAPGLGWSGGRVVDGLVSNVDVVPTLLDAVGAPVPDAVHGNSLVPVLTGQAAGTGRDEVFGEITFHTYYDPRRCIRTRDHKLIVNFEEVPPYMQGASQSWRPWSTPRIARWGPGPQSVRVELYDLTTDPDEFHNVADEPAMTEIREDLRARLLDWMRRTDDPLLDGPVVSPSYRRARQALGAEVS